MVCDRCIMVIEDELKKLNIVVEDIKLGEVVLSKELSQDDKNQLNQRLHSLGFELIDDKKTRMIEQIKSKIIEQIHHQTAQQKTNFSEILSRQLNHDYNYLSNLFSEIEGTTIEKYVIAQKIEKVKELIIYDELSLSEIADLLNYSSVAYLSNQFKKVTGLTPSAFKLNSQGKRKAIDKI